MNLKIIYRSAVIWNIVLHFLLSILFLILQQAIFQEKSVLNSAFFKTTFLNYWPIVTVIFLSSFLVFNLKKVSQDFFMFTVFVVSLTSAVQLWFEFSKLILLVLFIYILASYYLRFMLKEDLNQAYYNPGFSDEDLFEPMLLKIRVDVIEKKSNKVFSGFLTNWDETGCFIQLEEMPKEKNLQLKLYFKGHVFTDNGHIATISKKNKAIGVRFHNAEAQLGWSEIYKIISDMGMDVEYIR